MKYWASVFIAFTCAFYSVASEPLVSWQQSSEDRASAIKGIFKKADLDKRYVDAFKAENRWFSTKKVENGYEDVGRFRADGNLELRYCDLPRADREKLDKNREEFQKAAEARRIAQESFCHNFDAIVAAQGLNAQNTHFIWALVAALHLSRDADLIKLGYRIIDSYQSNPDWLTFLTGYEWGGTPLRSREQSIYRAVQELEKAKVYDELLTPIKRPEATQPRLYGVEKPKPVVTVFERMTNFVKNNDSARPGLSFYQEDEKLRAYTASWFFEALQSPQVTFDKFFRPVDSANALVVGLYDYTRPLLQPSLGDIQERLHDYCWRASQACDVSSIQDENTRQKFAALLAKMDSELYAAVVDNLKRTAGGMSTFGRGNQLTTDFFARCLLRIHASQSSEDLHYFVQRVMPFVANHAHDNLSSLPASEVVIQKLKELEEIFALKKPEQPQKTMGLEISREKDHLKRARALLGKIFIHILVEDIKANPDRPQDRKAFFEERFNQAASMYQLLTTRDHNGFFSLDAALENITCLKNTDKTENYERALHFVEAFGGLLKEGTLTHSFMKVRKDVLGDMLPIFDRFCQNYTEKAHHIPEVTGAFHQACDDIVQYHKDHQPKKGEEGSDFVPSKEDAARVLFYLVQNGCRGLMNYSKSQQKDVDMDFYFRVLSEIFDEEDDVSRYLLSFKGTPQEMYFANLIMKETRYNKGFNIQLTWWLASSFVRWMGEMETPPLPPLSDANKIKLAEGVKYRLITEEDSQDDPKARAYLSKYAGYSYKEDSEEARKLKAFLAAQTSEIQLEEEKVIPAFPLMYVGASRYTSDKSGEIDVHFFQICTPNGKAVVFTKDVSQFGGFTGKPFAVYTAPFLKCTHVRKVKIPNGKESRCGEIKISKKAH